MVSHTTIVVWCCNSIQSSASRARVQSAVVAKPFCMLVAVCVPSSAGSMLHWHGANACRATTYYPHLLPLLFLLSTGGAWARVAVAVAVAVCMYATAMGECERVIEFVVHKSKHTCMRHDFGDRNRLYRTCYFTMVHGKQVEADVHAVGRLLFIPKKLRCLGSSWAKGFIMERPCNIEMHSIPLCLTIRPVSSSGYVWHLCISLR